MKTEPFNIPESEVLPLMWEKVKGTACAPWMPQELG